LYGISEPLFNTKVYSISSSLSYLFPPTISVKLEPDINGSPTLSCAGSPMCNQICQANATLCSGDNSFCSNTTCSQSSECYCTIANAAFNTYIYVNDTQQKVLQITNALIYNCIEPENLKRFISDNTTTEIDLCSIYTLPIDDNIIKISILPPSEEIGYLKILYHGETKILQLSDSITMYTIPPTWLSTTGDITLEYTATGQYCYSTYPIVAKYQCEMQDCFFCTSVYSNYKCLPGTYQSIIFWGTFLMIVLILFMAPFIGYIIYLLFITIFELFRCCFVYTRGFHKTKLMKNIYATAYSKQEKIKHYLKHDVENPTIDITVKQSLNNNQAEDEFEDIPLNISEYRKPKHSKRNMTKTDNTTTNVKNNNQKVIGRMNGRPIYYVNIIFCLSVLFLVIPCDSTCSQGASVGSTQTQCLTSGTSQICTENYNVLATIPTTGSEYCFSLTSNNSAVWTGSVRHLGMVASLSLTSLYYTSSWSGFSQSVHYCDGTSKCSGGCSGTQSTRTAGGALTDNRLNIYPGTTICHPSCGCVTCDNCFLCSPSCLYSAYGVIPTGKVYQVFAINSIIYTPNILVTISGPGINIAQTISPSSVATVMGNFTTQLVGAFTPPQISVSNFNILREVNSQNYYFTYGANLNQITSGIPGDIQASTSAGLTGVPPSFRIGSIVTTNQGDLGDTYVFQAPGVSSTFNTWSKIPTTIGGNIWTLSSNTVISNITNPPALAISIQTPSGLKFSRTVNVVCPSFTVTNASGCFSCDGGSIITILAYSTCSSGAVSISTSDFSLILLTPGLTLTLVPSIYNIAIQTNRASNSFSLVLSSSFSSQSKQVDFTAVEIIRVVDNNTTDSNTTITAPRESPILTDFINFSTSIGGIITWVIIGLVVLVSLFVLFPIFYNMIKTSMNPPKKD